MKLGEVVVHIKYYSFNKFHYILMKKIIHPNFGLVNLGLMKFSV